MAFDKVQSSRVKPHICKSPVYGAWMAFFGMQVGFGQTPRAAFDSVTFKRRFATRSVRHERSWDQIIVD